MSRVASAPVIPDPVLHERWEQSPRLQEAHAGLAGMPLDKFWSDMPEVTRPDADAQELSVVDLSPKTDHDRTRATALILQWENGWRPATAYPAKMLQDGQEEPGRVLVFPFAKGDVDVTEEELTLVHAGFFSPIGLRLLRTAARLGIEHLDVAGGSNGATIGANVFSEAQYFDEVDAHYGSLIEPVNIVDRPRKDIEKAMRKVGLGNLNQAKNDSGLPGLANSELSQGRLHVPRQLLMLTSMLRPSDFGKAAKEGYTHPQFQEDLWAAATGTPDIRVLVTTAEKGDITSADGVKALRAYLEGLRNVQIREGVGYGHEFIDNAVATVLTHQMGLDPATYQAAA